MKNRSDTFADLHFVFQGGAQGDVLAGGDLSDRIYGCDGIKACTESIHNKALKRKCDRHIFLNETACLQRRHNLRLAA